MSDAGNLIKRRRRAAKQAGIKLPARPKDPGGAPGARASRSERIRALGAAGSWDAALRLAAGHMGRDDDARTVARAAEALSNPGFYSAMGKDQLEFVEAGIAVLRRRFGASSG